MLHVSVGDIAVALWNMNVWLFIGVIVGFHLLVLAFQILVVVILAAFSERRF